MTRILPLLTLLLLPGLASCAFIFQPTPPAPSRAAASPPPAQVLRYETIDGGAESAYGWNPGTPGPTEPQVVVLRSRVEFNDFWARHHASRSPLPPLPTVDFKEAMVVAVLDAVRPSGGYQVTVRQVEEGINTVWVAVDRTVPGPGCFTSAVLTRPYQVLTMKLTNLSISPQFFDVKRDCAAAEPK